MESKTELDSSATPQASNAKTPQQENDPLVQENNPLVMDAYNIIKDLQEMKRDFESFSTSQKDNFQKIENHLKSINEAKTKALTLIEKETKTYNIILAIWWCFFVCAILSFFILPIIGFILLYILSPTIVLEKFSSFFNSLLAYLGAAIGLILFGGFQNLYRRVNSLQKDIDGIKNIKKSEN